MYLRGINKQRKGNCMVDMDVKSLDEERRRGKKPVGGPPIAERRGRRHGGSPPQAPRLHRFPLLVLPETGVGIKTGRPLEFEPTT